MIRIRKMLKNRLSRQKRIMRKVFLINLESNHLLFVHLFRGGAGAPLKD